MDRNNKLSIMFKNGEKWRIIMSKVSSFIRIGVTTKEIDNIISKLLLEFNCESAPIKLYNFPGYACLSINSCACHGVPDNYVLKSGDVLTVDLSYISDGYYVDGARNYVLIDYAKCTRTDIEHLAAAGFVQCLVEQAVYAANQLLLLGKLLYSNFFGDIMYNIILKSQYNMCVNYCGHAIGELLHLVPLIPNGPSIENMEYTQLKENDAFCIEPIISYKNNNQVFMKVLTKGWNVYNEDREHCFHYENTYIILNNQIVVIT